MTARNGKLFVFAIATSALMAVCLQGCAGDDLVLEANTTTLQPTTTATPVINESDNATQVILTLTIEGVNLEELSEEPSRLAAFKTAVKEAIAEEAGHGVIAAHVALTLRQAPSMDSDTGPSRLRRRLQSNGTWVGATISAPGTVTAVHSSLGSSSTLPSLIATRVAKAVSNNNANSITVSGLNIRRAHALTTPCQPPAHWCSIGPFNTRGGPLKRDLTRDCDGDGVADPFCMKPNFDGYSTSYQEMGYISSLNGCQDTWAQKDGGNCGVCPDCGCAKPTGWCDPPKVLTHYRDCDGDFKKELHCYDPQTNTAEYLSAKDQCRPNTGACQKDCFSGPGNNFCNKGSSLGGGVANFKLDCDGDGVIDPICGRCDRISNPACTPELEQWQSSLRGCANMGNATCPAMSCNRGDPMWNFLAGAGFGLGPSYNTTRPAGFDHDNVQHGTSLEFGCVSNWKFKGRTMSKVTVRCIFGEYHGQLSDGSDFQLTDDFKCSP